MKVTRYIINQKTVQNYYFLNYKTTKNGYLQIAIYKLK